MDGSVLVSIDGSIPVSVKGSCRLIIENANSDGRCRAMWAMIAANSGPACRCRIVI
jgi:hypothetical protein